MTLTTLTRRPTTCHVRPTDEATGRKAVRSIGGLTKLDAEQWLDWLEAQGCESFGLSCSREGGFTVWFK